MLPIATTSPTPASSVSTYKLLPVALPALQPAARPVAAPMAPPPLVMGGPSLDMILGGLGAIHGMEVKHKTQINVGFEVVSGTSASGETPGCVGQKLNMGVLANETLSYLTQPSIHASFVSTPDQPAYYQVGIKAGLQIGAWPGDMEIANLKVTYRPGEIESETQHDGTVEKRRGDPIPSFSVERVSLNVFDPMPRDSDALAFKFVASQWIGESMKAGFAIKSLNCSFNDMDLVISDANIRMGEDGKWSITYRSITETQNGQSKVFENGHLEIQFIQPAKDEVKLKPILRPGFELLD